MKDTITLRFEADTSLADKNHRGSAQVTFPVSMANEMLIYPGDSEEPQTGNYGLDEAIKAAVRFVRGE